MNTFVLTYDLVGERDAKDYEPLWEELRRVGAQRTLLSVWLVAFRSDAKAVHDHFKTYLHAKDRLWVSELTKENYYSNAMAGTNDWLKKHPPPR